MAITLTRNGYGQVEPNQLSAQKTGQIYASLPLDPDVDVLQNGEFMYYDAATGYVTATDSTGIAEPYLVFNEVKLYEPFWRTSYKDFAMIRVNGVDAQQQRVAGENYVTSDLATAGYGDGATNIAATISPAHTEYPYRMEGFAPRLFKTNIGDIMTTNMVKPNASYAVGNKLVPVLNSSTGTLQLEVASGTPTGMVWVVVKETTMPDGQLAVKLQRVQ